MADGTITLKTAHVTVGAFGAASVTYDRDIFVLVDVFKIFTPGKGTNFRLGFQRRLDEGVTIGLLVHEIYNEAYHVVATAKIMDSMSNNWGEQFGSYYVAPPDRVKVSLRSVICGSEIKGFEIRFTQQVRGITHLVGQTSKMDLVGDEEYTGVDLSFVDKAFELDRERPLCADVLIGGKKVYGTTFSYDEMTAKELNDCVREASGKTYKVKLVVRFDYSAPVVVWPLEVTLGEGHRAVFCRVFRAKGMDPGVKVGFEANEMYGVLVFSELKVTLGKGDCYAVLSLPSLTPLVEGQQMSDTHWVIRLNADILKDGILTLPFRRQSPGSMDSQVVGLLRIFHGPHTLFCEGGIDGVTVGGEWMGCVEPRPRVENMAHDWLALLPVKMKPNHVKADAVRFDSFRLQLFLLPAGGLGVSSIGIFPSKYVIGNRTAFIIVRHKAVAGLIARKLPVFFKAPEATRVELECGRVRTPFSKKTVDGSAFEAEISCKADMQVDAVIDEGTDVVFRVFELSYEGSALFIYHDIDGLIEVGDEDKREFESGFKQQVIVNPLGRRVYKTWNGKYEIKPVPRSGTIVVRVVCGTHFWRLEVWLEPPSGGRLMINWGVRKYTRDPFAFFAGLGIAQFGGEYREEAGNMWSTGEIVIPAGGMNLEGLKNKGKKIHDFLDLPEGDWNYVFKVSDDEGKTWRLLEDDVPEGEEVSVRVDESSLFMIEVMVGAFFGALVIAVIGLGIYRRRFQKGRDSSSLGSGQSSSDEVRQPLTLMIE